MPLTNKLLFSNNSGNVGIGNNSPAVKLDIQDTGRSGSTYTSGTVFYATSSVDDLQFIGQFRHQNQSQGIGFSYNAIRQTGSNINEVFNLCSRGTGNLNLRYGSTDISLGTIGLTLLGSNGNVGIGTTAPGSKLTVSGSNSGSVPLVDLIASGTGTFQRGVRLLNSGMNSGDQIMYAVGQADNSKNMGQFYFYYSGSNSNSNRISMGLHSVDDVFNILGSGNVGIGTTSPSEKLHVIGSILASANVTAYSDIRIKTNIRTIENAIDKVKKIRGVTYDRTDDPDLPRQTGVIAQEVKEVLPEVVSGSEESKYTVAYGNMVGLLIEAIKEQQSEIDELKVLVRQLLAK